MYTVRENDTVNNCVHIPMRMIREFGCADGWIGIVRYDSFARLADSHIADGGSIYAHGAISYGVPRSKADRRDVPRHDMQPTYQNAQVRLPARVSIHRVTVGRASPLTQ